MGPALTEHKKNHSYSAVKQNDRNQHFVSQQELEFHSQQFVPHSNGDVECENEILLTHCQRYSRQQLPAFPVVQEASGKTHVSINKGRTSGEYYTFSNGSYSPIITPTSASDENAVNEGPTLLVSAHANGYWRTTRTIQRKDQKNFSGDLYYKKEEKMLSKGMEKGFGLSSVSYDSLKRASDTVSLEVGRYVKGHGEDRKPSSVLKLQNADSPTDPQQSNSTHFDDFHYNPQQNRNDARTRHHQHNGIHYPFTSPLASSVSDNITINQYSQRRPRSGFRDLRDCEERMLVHGSSNILSCPYDSTRNETSPESDTKSRVEKTTSAPPIQLLSIVDRQRHFQVSSGINIPPSSPATITAHSGRRHKRHTYIALEVLNFILRRRRHLAKEAVCSLQQSLNAHRYSRSKYHAEITAARSAEVFVLEDAHSNADTSDFYHYDRSLDFQAPQENIHRERGESEKEFMYDDFEGKMEDEKNRNNSKNQVDHLFDIIQYPRKAQSAFPKPNKNLCDDIVTTDCFNRAPNNTLSFVDADKIPADFSPSLSSSFGTSVSYCPTAVSDNVLRTTFKNVAVEGLVTFLNYTINQGLLRLGLRKLVNHCKNRQPIRRALKDSSSEKERVWTKKPTAHEYSREFSPRVIEAEEKQGNVVHGKTMRCNNDASTNHGCREVFSTPPLLSSSSLLSSLSDRSSVQSVVARISTHNREEEIQQRDSSNLNNRSYHEFSEVRDHENASLWNQREEKRYRYHEDQMRFSERERSTRIKEKNSLNKRNGVSEAASYLCNSHIEIELMGRQHESVTSVEVDRIVDNVKKVKTSIVLMTIKQYRKSVLIQSFQQWRLMIQKIKLDEHRRRTGAWRLYRTFESKSL